MFSFLKDKLKQAIGKFTKNVENETKPAEQPAIAKPQAIEKPHKKEQVKDKKPVHIKKDAHIATKKEKEGIVALGHTEPPKHEIPKPEEADSQKEEIIPSTIHFEPTHQIIEEKVIEPSIEPAVKAKDIKIGTEVPIEAKVKPKETSFFQRLKDSVTKRTLSEEKFDELFFDLELAMLENNVAFEVVEKIKGDLKRELVNSKVGMGKLEETITNTLSESIVELFDVKNIDIMARIKEKRPLVILFLGVNGAGKTTTIAKFAHMLKNKGFKLVIAAADTFRAAAIQQIEEHAKKLDIKLIKHDYGSDPAAVAFDAIKYAESKSLDVVLIDTAGRQHSNSNLMEEMKKVIRVAKPDIKIFVGESITGNDCVEQAKSFDSAIGIDGIILSKADVDEKGGAAISISYVTKKPILFIGTGQGYASIAPFDKDTVLERLGL